jgi:hypothetical protein
VDYAPLGTLGTPTYTWSDNSYSDTGAVIPD